VRQQAFDPFIREKNQDLLESQSNAMLFDDFWDKFVLKYLVSYEKRP
jgi:hypothetical protein